jgi:hypothetical protein
MNGSKAKRIEYNSKSDDFGRCSFTLFWDTDYTPSMPYPHERGQGFFADPRKRGFPRPEEVENIKNKEKL